MVTDRIMPYANWQTDSLSYQSEDASASKKEESTIKSHFYQTFAIFNVNKNGTVNLLLAITLIFNV